MQNKYRILVTGATGLCGKNIVDYFQRNSNYEIFLTSRKFNDTQNKIKCDLTKFSNINFLNCTLSPVISTYSGVLVRYLTAVSKSKTGRIS